MSEHTQNASKVTLELDIADARFLAELGLRLKTQDGMDTPEGPSHATANPVYMVQQKVRIYIDPSSCEIDGYEQDDDGEDIPYLERWELVKGAVALTREGIESYLRKNSRLNQPRIYVGSLSRVDEMIRVQRILSRLADG